MYNTVYSGHNLASILGEGYRRNIISFIPHCPKGLDFHIDLDILLGNKNETKHLRTTLADREAINALVPLPEIWTTKTERAYLLQFSNALYRTLWEHPFILELRQIFMERYVGLNIDAFFDFICLHILHNFFNNRQAFMFDAIEKIQARLMCPPQQTKGKSKKRPKKEKNECETEFFSLCADLYKEIKRFRIPRLLPYEYQELEAYKILVEFCSECTEETTNLIFKNWRQQPEIPWSDILQEIYDTVPIHGENDEGINYTRRDWFDWWKEHRPPC